VTAAQVCLLQHGAVGKNAFTSDPCSLLNIVIEMDSALLLWLKSDCNMPVPLLSAFLRSCACLQRSYFDKQYGRVLHHLCGLIVWRMVTQVTHLRHKAASGCSTDGLLHLHQLNAHLSGLCASLLQSVINAGEVFSATDAPSYSTTDGLWHFSSQSLMLYAHQHRADASPHCCSIGTYYNSSKQTKHNRPLCFALYLSNPPE